MMKLFSVSTKHLYNIYAMLDQRRRRLVGLVYMLYKYIVFTAGYGSLHLHQILLINHFTNVTLANC